jgi:Golgi phosphoprotein 3 (GPP34)
MTNLIAEDLVLLLLDDESGTLEPATYLDTGIGGALLVELALAEKPRTRHREACEADRRGRLVHEGGQRRGRGRSGRPGLR